MIPGTFNLTVRRGSTFGPVVITCLNSEGEPVDLTDWLAYAKVRSAPKRPVVFDLSPTVTDEMGGEVTIPVISDENTLLMRHGDFVWDLLLERPNGDKLGPFLAGDFTVSFAISREET